MNNTIRLLNNTEYSKSELIEKMYDDDFYYGFLGENALSSSSIKDLLDGRYFDKSVELASATKEAFKIGRLIHLAVLEPERIAEQHIGGNTRASKEYKQLVEEVGSSDNVYTNRMVEKATRFADKVWEDNAWLFNKKGLHCELPEIGIVDGLPFRGKADMIVKSEGERNVIVDLKTTSNLAMWQDSAIRYSYDIQLYIYCILFSVKPEDFYWLAMCKRNGDSKLFRGSDTLYQTGREKTLEAIKIYVDGLFE